MLKYVVLASILSASQINYCDTREAKVYKDDPEIVAINRLREAYEKNNINEINSILND
jgi:COP9 signalosome complex subunit 2